MNLTSHQAETYLDSVDGALTVRGLRPETFFVADSDDELAEGRVTALPCAVLTWPARHTHLDPHRFPHGAVATWTPATGWAAAALQSDGTSNCPTPLPLTVLGEPTRVVDVISHVLLGRAAPEGTAEHHGGETPLVGPARTVGGPEAEPALAVVRAEIWGHFHSDPRGRTAGGRFATGLSFPVSDAGGSWSQKGVRITYGDTHVVADLDGYSEFLELIAGRCPLIDGPLVLTL